MGDKGKGWGKGYRQPKTHPPSPPPRFPPPGYSVFSHWLLCFFLRTGEVRETEVGTSFSVPRLRKGRRQGRRQGRRRRRQALRMRTSRKRLSLTMCRVSNEQPPDKHSRSLVLSEASQTVYSTYLYSYGHMHACIHTCITAATRPPALPEGFSANTEKTYTGTVSGYYKFNGYGFRGPCGASQPPNSERLLYFSESDN